MNPNQGLGGGLGAPSFNFGNATPFGTLAPAPAATTATAPPTGLKCFLRY